MIIEITSNNKILKKSPSLYFPPFVVLTGENGSGKTQFLREIAESIFRRDLTNPMNHRIKYSKILNSDRESYMDVVITRPGLEIIPNSYMPISYPSERPSNQASQEILDGINNGWTSLDFIIKTLRLNPQLNDENYRNEGIVDLHNNEVEKFLNSVRITRGTNYGDEKLNYPKISLADLDKVFTLAKKTKKDPKLLELADSIIFHPIYSDFLSSKIEFILHQFEFKKTLYPHLVENEASPIDVLNDLLKSARFNYTASYNPSTDIKVLGEFKLIDNDRGISIDINNLSSGEKTILSLIFILYSSNRDGRIPDLLLLDEPDTFLHPSMVEILIDVLGNVLVKKHKKNIIITTHSPTTVALAPEDSIYRMNRDKGYPEKIHKNSAINSLIDGINGLVVSLSNRRQVFVESDYDILYYEGIYKLLRKKLNEEIQLNFISSGMTKVDPNGDEIATCERVKSITKEMRSYNNKQIFGIIDWDLKNKLTEGIAILGNGKRYSIENYLLDPIFIGLILQRESHLTFEQMGILDKTYGQLLSFTQEDYQKISDFIITEISDLKSNVITCNHTDIEEYELINGVKIKIPKWFLYYQGHRLENDLIVKFPKLGELKRSKETGLKLAIINKLLKDNPEIMSKDFLAMFEFLHSN